MADNPTTGTPDDATGTAEEAGGSAERSEGGSVEASPEERIAELERQKQQLLAEKTAVEKARREAEEYRRQLADLESSQRTSSPGNDQDARLAREFQRLYAEGDPVAWATVKALQEQQQREARMREAIEYERIPQTDRDEVAKYYHSGYYASPSAAYRALKGDRYDAEQAKLADERKRLAEAQSRREAGTVDTVARSVSAGEVKSRTMTNAEYTAKLQSLPKDKALDLKRQAEKGLIVLKE